MPNPSLIFDKSSGGLRLDLGYGFEDLLMSAVVQIDFLICCSHDDSPPFLGKFAKWTHVAITRSQSVQLYVLDASDLTNLRLAD